MKGDVLLSVCVITYNQEKTISKTLDSILEQEHDYTYEIIVGEDCSTDNTRQIIEDYSLKYPEIVKPIFNLNNLGLIGNYFNTIEHCLGKYIMECAGDDWWLPGKVKKQIEFMEHHNDVGMCYGQVNIWRESDSVFEKNAKGGTSEDLVSLLKGNTIIAPTICIRNSLVRKYINEIEPIKKEWLMEDYPLWLWVAANSKIKFFYHPMAGYRMLQISASHNPDPKKDIAFMDSVYDIKRFFANKYNAGVSTWDLNHNLFDYFWIKLYNEYNELTFQALKKYRSYSKSLSFEYKLKFFLTSNKYLYKLYVFLNKAFQRIA